MDVNLREFINSPDTVPLIGRDGSLTGEFLRNLYNIRPGTILTGDYRVDYAEVEQVEKMAREIGENLITMIPIVFGLSDRRSLEEAGIMRLRYNPYLGLRGQGVLIGFVDTGIDYTLDCFKYEDGTSKIKFIWDQTVNGNSPNSFHFGAEYTQEELNNALMEENPLSLVPHNDTVGHGTFLASVAAGRDVKGFTGAAPEAEIIAVKLKKAPPFLYERFLIPKTQENTYSGSDLLLGIQYIVNKASELNRPAAICIALGSNLGGHDGFNITEEYLTRLSNIPGRALVCAAGNEAQAAHHTNGRIEKEGDLQVVEFLASEKSGDIYLSLWNSSADRIAVSIVSPSGEMVPKTPVRSGSIYTFSLVLEKSTISIEYFLPIRGSGDQFTRIKIFNPTPGIWKINIHGEIIIKGEYHIWLPLTGFIDNETVFLTPTPNCTIVTPASSTGVISCGAYNGINNTIYPSSSWGPTRMPRMAPDLVAPGVNVGGIYPTGYGQMSGTSVSAAITAGVCALLLEWGIVLKNDMTLTSTRIRSKLIRGCQRTDNTVYPNVQWGYGRLNAFESLKAFSPFF